MQRSIESHLKQTIFPDLERGRPGWDKPHTEAVVRYMRLLLEHWPISAEELDATVLFIAAYAHDWGYADLFDDGEPVQFDEVKDAKVAHMTRGASKLAALLEDAVFDALSSTQRERAVHLVEVHDKLEQLEDTDELLLMEADTLGALSAGVEHSTFDVASARRYLAAVKRRRLPLFITEYGKSELERLVQAYEDALL